MVLSPRIRSFIFYVEGAVPIFKSSHPLFPPSISSFLYDLYLDLELNGDMCVEHSFAFRHKGKLTEM